MAREEPDAGALKAFLKFYQNGDVARAESEVQRLITRFPRSSELWNMAGATKLSMKAFGEAVRCFENSIALDPDSHRAHSNMGNALKDMGDFDRALEAIDRALALAPDSAEAHYNKGIVLSKQMNYRAAIGCYSKSLQIRPKFTQALSNMGNAYKNLDELDRAIDCYTEAILSDQNHATAYVNLGQTIANKRVLEPAPRLQRALLLMLSKRVYARPRDLAIPILSLIRHDHSVWAAIKIDPERESSTSLLDMAVDLSEQPLLMALLERCPLPDIELENLLTSIRAALLSSCLDETTYSDLLSFQSKLALQCFVNEYIYRVSDNEMVLLTDAISRVELAIEAGKQPNLNLMLAIASYVPLHTLTWNSHFAQKHQMQEVFERQVLEPRRELEIKREIPTFTEISGTVSGKVRDQYEENPYPRWVDTKAAEPSIAAAEIFSHFNLRISSPFEADFQKPAMLVAGCGTGQHAIGCAARFKNARVTAVDLSLSSLAYAKRKTEELGMRNIEYFCGDLLELKKLTTRYDIIESVGVLHHMENPIDGWAVLADRLKPGGVMKVGLYSEIARREITEIRRRIEILGVGNSEEQIKKFRNMILKSEDPLYIFLKRSPDFFSSSGFRDLVFNVQEHLFNLADVETALKQLGLRFCGFEDERANRRFKDINPLDSERYDLGKWSSFEQENPRIFAGMYLFWCQKI